LLDLSKVLFLGLMLSREPDGAEHFVRYLADALRDSPPAHRLEAVCAVAAFGAPCGIRRDRSSPLMTASR